MKIEASASGDTGAPGDILEGQVEVQVTTNVEVKEEAPVDEGKCMHTPTKLLFYLLPLISGAGKEE